MCKTRNLLRSHLTSRTAPIKPFRAQGKRGSVLISDFVEVEDIDRTSLRYIYELHIFKIMSDEVHAKALNKNFYVRLQEKFKSAYQRAVLQSHIAPPAYTNSEKRARARGRWKYAVRMLKPTNSAVSALNLKTRYSIIREHYPGALDMEEFMLRVEAAFYRYGFTQETSIALTAMCRDEACCPLQAEIESVFGDSFHTNGLGGVITCGATGLKAFMSHSPMRTKAHRERYIFFSFPHIAINANGEVGVISRPNRTGDSHACGALQASLGTMKRDGLSSILLAPYNRLDPEYSIMNKRLALKTRERGESKQFLDELNLVDFTAMAEEAYTEDLEELIKMTVNTATSDYAVVTGVHIHNWTQDYHGDEPQLEFVWPRKIYTVVDGERADIDLDVIDPPTPRQLNILGRIIQDRARAEEDKRHDMSRRIRKLLEENGEYQPLALKEKSKDDCDCPKASLDFMPLLPALAALAIGIGKRRPIR